MTFGGRQAGLLLLLGDLVFFSLSLWLTLILRYGRLPTLDFFSAHLVAFAPLFFLWTVVFFIYDLYRLRTLVFAASVPRLVLGAQLVNSVLAVLAFYFIPYFNRAGVTPKTTLFIYLIVSSGLILIWRQFLARRVYRRRRLSVAFQGEGMPIGELAAALEQTGNFVRAAPGERPGLVVINRYAALPESRLRELYQWLFHGVQFVSAQELYEEVFGRVPLELVNERWFLEQISNRPSFLYDALKRVMDVVIALLLVLASLPVYPLIILAIKLEDGGPIFFYDERVGRHGRAIRLAKFRTMTLEAELSARRVTGVGRILRRMRLDELPQLWSVVRGEQSLIGPRPERREYVEQYRQSIPFYEARHLIAPGLSGWAQMYHDNHPHFALAADATAEKLSYDLYYIKHRSLWLDLAIALKTIKVLAGSRGI